MGQHSPLWCNPAFVAQSVERFLGKEEVAGPIPAEGSGFMFYSSQHNEFFPRQKFGNPGYMPISADDWGFKGLIISQDY